MTITPKQRAAMAAIVLVGLLGGGAVWMSERPKAGEADAHGDHAGGHEGEAHGDAHDEKSPAGKAHADEHAGEAKTAHADEHKDDHADDHDDHKGEAAGAHKEEAHKDGDKDEHAHADEQGGAHGGEHEEALIRLSAEQQRAAGITVQAAGPAQLQAAAEFQGEIRFNDDRTAHVVPRLAGVAEAVPVSLGQSVQKGQVLAVIASTALSEQRSELLTAQKRRDLAKATYEREKKLWQEKISAEQDYLQAQGAWQEAEIAVQNASQKLSAVGAGAATQGLNRFEIRAPFAGTLVEKHLSLGESVKEDATIFTVSDLSSVWAEFAVAPKDLAAVRVGQRAIVSSTAFASQVEGRIAYVGALLGEQTRTARARVTLPNPQGAWRPGLFVTVAVMGGEQAAKLGVGVDAVQTIEGQPMLFVATAEGFKPTPVKLGRSDGKAVEVLSGLQPGQRYAAANTFVLKSELGKASAEHSH